MVADGVAHVTSVHMLCHFSRSTQPGGQTPLQCCIVGRNWGAGATSAPEDAICPGRFPLLRTEKIRVKEGLNVRVEFLQDTAYRK